MVDNFLKSSIPILLSIVLSSCSIAGTWVYERLDNYLADYFKEYAFKNDLQLIQGKTEKSKITYNISTGYIGGRADKNKLLKNNYGVNLIYSSRIPHAEIWV